MAYAVLATVPTPTGDVTVQLGRFNSLDTAENAKLAVQWAAVTLVERVRPGSRPLWFAATAEVGNTSDSDLLDDVPDAVDFLANGATPILCGLCTGTLSLAEANQRTLSGNGFGRILGLRASLVQPWSKGAIRDLKRAVADSGF
jgi:hypothetical protein